MPAADEGLAQMVRALLTDGEKKAVRDDPEMDQNTKSSHISRIKNKISLMAEDSEELKEHRPELYEDLHRSVCEDTVEQRIEDLEAEVHLLTKRIEQLEAATETADTDSTS